MGFEPTTPTLARLCCANCGSAFNSNYMIARRVRPQRRTRAACGDPICSFRPALRRVERKTRLRAEWTAGGSVERFFDYVPKGTRPAGR